MWRLQQSSPHHTSSATNTIIPAFPEALPELQAPQEISKLLHGLEESKGALYEIGVTDDGALIGLAEDEMLESLNNLRAMAACLGCTVEVLRKEVVGECEWLEESISGGKERKIRRVGKLIVVEALVKPFLHAKSPVIDSPELPQHLPSLDGITNDADLTPSSTEQLRITLTGPTMSGKSTLLGTLTTSTLDNGRGTSRLSMLKHRHEITSGITSSVTQELLGYQDGTGGSLEVVNYATENVAAWIDIHVAAANNRLVLVSDSAGHPRYRRTTLRGLVGWAPHWTLLCIPAGDVSTTSNIVGSPLQHPGAAMSEMDLSGAQMDLCLRLSLPLVIVITKLDLASRSGLRERLTKILDTLKAAGRRPVILPNRPGAVSEEDLQSFPISALDSVRSAIGPSFEDKLSIVPIVLTSAVDGTGIGNLHALLHILPISASPAQVVHDAQSAVFHVEDVYSKPAEGSGVIISGRLRSGLISVGDVLELGPFSGHDPLDDSEDSDERPLRKANAQPLASRSFPGALRGAHFASPSLALPTQEWRRVKVTSIRNLRLPVHFLNSDQVGTIAVVLENEDSANRRASDLALSRIRKGMVLASSRPVATRTFSARFKREDLESLAVGNHVVVYISSVRAPAKIISARTPDTAPASPVLDEQSHEPFSFDDVNASLMDGREMFGPVAGVVTAAELVVTLNFDAATEFVMVGDQALLMPGGGPGLYGGLERGEKGVAGLEGFVGVITEVHA
jgi:GTPase